MQLTKLRLKQIIKEEIQHILNELIMQNPSEPVVCPPSRVPLGTCYLPNESLVQCVSQKDCKAIILNYFSEAGEEVADRNSSGMPFSHQEEGWWRSTTQESELNDFKRRVMREEKELMAALSPKDEQIFSDFENKYGVDLITAAEMGHLSQASEAVASDLGLFEEEDVDEDARERRLKITSMFNEANKLLPQLSWPALQYIEGRLNKLFTEPDDDLINADLDVHALAASINGTLDDIFNFKRAQEAALERAKKPPSAAKPSDGGIVQDEDSNWYWKDGKTGCLSLYVRPSDPEKLKKVQNTVYMHNRNNPKCKEYVGGREPAYGRSYQEWLNATPEELRKKFEDDSKD